MSSVYALPDYAELHALSNFSFQRGASHAEELAERASELGYQALAVTDECSVAGVVKAHEAARCGAGSFLEQHHPLRRLMFLRFTDWPWRKMAMMIASPTAASAAATVITNTTKTWPVVP